MTRSNRRSYLTEPTFGEPKGFNTSKMTQDKGTPDNPNPKRDTPTTPTKVERRSVRESLKDLKGMGTGSQNYKDTAQKSKEDTLKRLADKRKEREESRSKSGRERGNKRGMDRYMAERKRKDEGQSQVIST